MGSAPSPLLCALGRCDSCNSGAGATRLSEPNSWPSALVWHGKVEEQWSMRVFFLALQ